jgi:NAD(P)-dependent dehydrogenase (short-subunit alcohol dehydrogenase family)
MASTLITTPFDFESTAGDVIAGVDLTGKRAIVTGASSGIGIETARALAGAGAEVTLAVRDVEAGSRVAAEIGGSTRVAALDLGDLASVRAFAAAWSGPLDILINNAGVMALPTLQRSAEGHELQFATNHLGHFALATGLHGALRAAGRSRLVALSSVGHLRAGVDFDDVDFERRPYDPMVAYGQSKTADVLFAVEAQRRWEADGVTANAVHPGAIDSGLSRHMDPDVLADLRASGRYRFKTPQQGAATSVLLATWPALEGIGGRYFEHGNEAAVLSSPLEGPHAGGVADYALDPDRAARLWTLSEGLINSRRESSIRRQPAGI